MTNSNSLFNKFSRYTSGGTTEHANGFIEWWERDILPISESDTIYVVEDFFENRLDLISSTFLGDVRWWWLLAQYNNIIDPFSEITSGSILRIPTQERLPLLVSTLTGGVPSTKQDVKTISPVIT